MLDDRQAATVPLERAETLNAEEAAHWQMPATGTELGMLLQSICTAQAQVHGAGMSGGGGGGMAGDSSQHQA